MYRFGPHRIGPYQVAKGTDTVSPPPVDGAIVGMDTRLVTRAGAEVPQSEVMLHHIVYTDGGPTGAGATAPARSGRSSSASSAPARSCAR